MQLSLWQKNRGHDFEFEAITEETGKHDKDLFVIMALNNASSDSLWIFIA